MPAYTSVDAYLDYIKHASLDQMKHLKRTLKAIVKNPPTPDASQGATPKEPEDAAIKMYVLNKLQDAFVALNLIYPETDEEEIINSLKVIVSQYPEQKHIPNEINDIQTLIQHISATYNIDDIDALYRDIETLGDAGIQPPDYEKNMGDDALAPPKEDDEEDVVISERKPYVCTYIY